MQEPARAPAIDVLLLAAHRVELADFEHALGPDLRGCVGGLQVAAAEVGVGLTTAGAGAARALLQRRPRAAILVGSYGAYATTPAPSAGSLLVPDALRALEPAVLEGKAAFPQPMPVSVALEPALVTGVRGAGRGVLGGVLGTTLAITTDDVLAGELGACTGCVGENLEALAVALACAGAAVPCAVVAGCTNRAGAQGRGQWRQHHAALAQACAELVLRWLASGAPGLPP